ncbi:MAG: amino acid permease, partial [Isosphaeraceae bacterium]
MIPHSATPHSDSGAKPRASSFSTATATFVVVSSMVGGGVLTTSGFTVGETQSNALMLALWAFGGLVALCGALTLGELSAALPRAGGEYAILAEAYGPCAAFLSGWVSLILGFAAPIAATGSAAADYLLTPLGLPDPLVSRAFASALILGFAAIHTTGRDQAARLQTAITVAILIVLTVFVVAGLIAGWPQRINLADWPGLEEVSPGALIFPLVYVAYAYTGWNAAAYLGGEVDDPKRLPRAIVLGTTLVVVLYLGMNTVYALALPAREVVALQRGGGPHAVERIADLAAGRLFPPGWSTRLSVGGGL